MPNETPNIEAPFGDAGQLHNGDSPAAAPQIEAQDTPLGTGGEVIGRVAAPPQLESTPEHFHFWVERNRLVESNQFVSTESTVEGQNVRFFGLIDEVRRSSRKRDILEEYDVGDGDALFEPPFKPDGVTYARASILRTEPEILTPALEQSIVRLGGEEEARIAYGFDDMKNRALPVGMLCNGARGFAGPALIDLAYLLGERGGHLNVNGMAGVAAKSSFLLTVIKLLLNKAVPRPSNEIIFIAPIIFNVKGIDLMWINKPNKYFGKRDGGERDFDDWKEKLKLAPEPFTDAELYCPPDPQSEHHAPSVKGCKTKVYYWSVADVFEHEAFPFLFSDEDTANPVFMALVYDIAAELTETRDRKLKLTASAPKTWDELLKHVRTQAEEKDRQNKMHMTGTWRALYRRLLDVLTEGRGIFPRNAREGKPLNVTRSTTSPPQVIDINSLPSSLQRFVVGWVINQIAKDRTRGDATPSFCYVIMLDELNRFAPRGGRDEITRLLERVATEMRSQGVILFGAQQLASQVSTKVIEMSSIRVLGRTGPAELQDKVWQSWEKSARQQAVNLQINQKLVWQPTFRYPMFVKAPFTPWAMRKADIDEQEEPPKGEE